MEHMTFCPECHHRPSRRIAEYVAECQCKCHDVADAAPDLLRIARILESFRVAGADSVSFSALMHDGDDTLGQAVRAAIAKAQLE